MMMMLMSVQVAFSMSTSLSLIWSDTKASELLHGMLLLFLYRRRTTVTIAWQPWAMWVSDLNAIAQPL